MSEKKRLSETPAVAGVGSAGARRLMVSVKGRCPCGCGETLMLGAGGYVTCSLLECPHPDAASDLLHTPFYGRLFLEQLKRERLAAALSDEGSNLGLTTAQEPYCATSDGVQAVAPKDVPSGPSAGTAG